MDARDAWGLARDAIRAAREESLRSYKDHEQASIRHWNEHDGNLKEAEARILRRQQESEARITARLGESQETLNRIIDQMLAKLNGGAKRASSIGPNLWAIEHSKALTTRITVVCAAVVAVATAAAGIVATYTP